MFAALVVAGGAAAYMSMRDSIVREDVGDNAALRPLQEQLADFPGCNIRYRTHHRMSDTTVLLGGCGESAAHASISVPSGWRFPDLAFEATRDAANRRWRIYVDKSKVPLDTLVTALGKLAPAVMTDGAAALKKSDESDHAWQQGQGDREKSAADRADKNRASYDGH